MRWLLVHRGNGTSSLLPALGAGVLIATVVVWFVSNNNTIFLRHQLHKHTRAIPQPVPRVLALADAVADVPSDFVGQTGWLPRVANSIAKRAYNHSERSQLLRVYLALGGKSAQPISWCPVPNQPCNDLVLVQVEGQPILLDPARGGALKQRGEFTRPEQLNGTWSYWPTQLPSMLQRLKDNGWINRWPTAVDRIDNLLAKVLTGLFLLIIIAMRIERWQRQRHHKNQDGESDNDALSQALGRSKMQSEQRRQDEDELQRALEDHHSDMTKPAIEQPMSEMVPAAAERVEAETQASDDQLSNLDKGQSE